MAPPSAFAYFLDVDGTLLEIRPRPQEVLADAALRGLVKDVAAAAGEALALVSGRKIDDIDRIFEPVILPAAGFDALATLEAVSRERATTLYGVPTMYVAELEHPELNRFDFSSLRKGVMSGAPCPIQLMKKVGEQMHMERMTIPYGQTESSPVITMACVDDPFERRVMTVG